MDTLTHAVVGALLVRAKCTTKQDPGLTHTRQVLVVAGAAMFPDLDYLGFWIDPYAFITQWHRGISHSLLMLPVWSLLLGCTLAWITGARSTYKQYSLLCGLGLLSHIVVDLLSVYGTQIFSPLSDYRAGLWLIFDADVCFALIASLGLLVGWSRVCVARWGLVALVLYLAGQAWFQHAANKVASEYAQREVLSEPVIYALPQPFATFYWRLIVVTPTEYWSAYLSLLPDESRLAPQVEKNFPALSEYKSPDLLKWSRTSRYGPEYLKTLTSEVWNQPEFGSFRKFAQLPVYYGIDKDSALTCIWFTDQRYLIPGLIPPFRYGMCQNAGDKDWSLYRLRRSQQHDKQRLRP